MDGSDCAEHDDDVGGGGKTGQKAEQNAQPAEKLADGNQIAEWPHHLYNRSEARPAERAKQFLRTVRHHSDTKKNAEGKECPVDSGAVA